MENWKQNLKSKVPGPIHFCGIGGTGMAPLAELCLAAGFSVQGSDPANSLNIQRIKARGAKIYDSHLENNIDGVATLVYSSAIKPDNIELSKAKSLGLKVLHRSELLALFVNQSKGITVAGTHGKSTTSALIAHIFEACGLNPKAAVGGTMLNYNANALCGEGEFFVAEADESDGTLLRYKPYIAIINNIEADHLDFFGSLTSIQECFKQYALATREQEGGTIVVNWDDPIARDLGISLKDHRLLSFGSRLGCDVRLLSSSKVGSGLVKLDVMVVKEKISLISPMIGSHNVSNVLCALATAFAAGIDLQKACDAVKSFAGVARRMCLIYSNETLSIYDDYAHNPGKIRAALSALKENFPDRKLICVFQPHRYSRLVTMGVDFYKSFSAADQVIVLPVYSAGEKRVEGFSVEEVAASIQTNSGVTSIPAHDFDLAKSKLLASNHIPAIIITVGAGDVWTLARDLGKDLDTSNQKRLINNSPSLGIPSAGV